MAIRIVGICLRPDRPEASETLQRLLKWMDEKGLEARVDEPASRFCERPGHSHAELAAEVDLLVVLGGDGTLLRVASSVGARHVPILGVNLGTLGYLAEVTASEMLPTIERVFRGEYRVQTRRRIAVSVERAGETILSRRALNDAVIATRATKMIELETYADATAVTTYYGDGLIVSTPTGSTAYSMSAGGPILLPGSSVISLTPICPHTLTQRPLVLPDDLTIQMIVHTCGVEVALTVDGQEVLALADADRVCVKRSPDPIELVESPFTTPFEILRSKLRWGER